MALPANSLGQKVSRNGRKLTVLALFLILLLGRWYLGPMESSTANSGGAFFSAALQPTLSDQNQSLPDDATPFAIRILCEMGNTIRYALIAMSMAVPAGLALGFFASSAWWPVGTGRSSPLSLSRLLLRPLHGITRLFITLMRSIHELIWAIFFLSALGDDPLTACIALALPFAGTLAKVFSEIIDELPRQAQDHVLSSGASPIQSFFSTLIPQAFPDLATYTLYRFECALRSSAVLGFIGIETIGLSIKRSFENNFYNELWTQLYLLIGVIMLVDILGAQLRRRLNSIPERKIKAPCLQPIPANKSITIRYLKTLKRSAPRWQLPRIVLWMTMLLTTVAWFPSLLQIDTQPLLSDQGTINREERVLRFLNKITPAPIRQSGPTAAASPDSTSWTDTLPWAAELWDDPGKEALTNTLVIATSSIIIAALCAWLVLPWASRSLANAKPLGMFHGRTSALSNLAWKLTGFLCRFLFLLSRAIPEYIIAYLLIALLGINAWPLVLALAIHNFGILGRLWGEVMENQSPESGKQLLQGGANRWQCYLNSYLPASFNRFMLYLFYRWETCVREATILGMLGVVSLGYHIQLARNFSRAYDEMFFYVLLGASVIFIGDLISFFLRRALMKS